MSLLIYLPLHHPAPPCASSSYAFMCVSIFSRADSSHSCPLTTRVVWDFDLLFISVMPFSVHTSAFCSLSKLVRSVVDHVCPPIDLSYLSAPLDTGVQTTPKAEVPRSPVSSSAPPSQRNITLSQRVPQRPSRPFSTSKTFTTSHISTTKGNGAMQISDSFFQSSCSRFRPLFLELNCNLYLLIYGHI